MSTSDEKDAERFRRIATEGITLYRIGIVWVAISPNGFTRRGSNLGDVIDAIPKT